MEGCYLICLFLELMNKSQCSCDCCLTAVLSLKVLHCYLCLVLFKNTHTTQLAVGIPLSGLEVAQQHCPVDWSSTPQISEIGDTC